MRQLTEVLTYLHSNGKKNMRTIYNISEHCIIHNHPDIVHRDLKLENVLLKSPINSATDKIDIRVSLFVICDYKRPCSYCEDCGVMCNVSYSLEGVANHTNSCA